MVPYLSHHFLRLLDIVGMVFRKVDWTALAESSTSGPSGEEAEPESFRDTKLGKIHSLTRRLLDRLGLLPVPRE